jgi:hypothetical protein
MTALDILTLARDAGIVLKVRGDILHVDAPAGRLTPELRDLLARRKPELLALLAPVTEYVYLRGGLTVPRPALELALDLERRGFHMRLDEHQQFEIEPHAALTESDRARIGRWRLHLAAVFGYQVPTCA